MTFIVPDRYYNFSPWYYLLLIPVAPLFVLLSTPFLRRTKTYKYYSALFLTFGETAKRFEIHSGPSIDYLMFLRGVAPGEELKRAVLGFYFPSLNLFLAKKQ